MSADKAAIAVIATKAQTAITNASTYNRLLHAFA
jgi:hypothetical protein